jgi:D-3-phosphoglycerate dehydrogenase / 2-oxoglutarate reductase
VGCDPYLAKWPEGVTPVSMENLIKTSDFISVHVHLSPETRGLVSRELLERIKPGAVVINTSRGAVMDEEALLEGLASGRIAGAGLDVLDGEPDTARHPLVEYAREHDNVIITPHCGGFSPDAVRVVCARAAEKIREALGRGGGA